MRSFASDNNSGVHPLVMEARVGPTGTMQWDMVMMYGRKRLSAKSGKLLLRIANRCLYSMEPAAMLLPYSYARVLIIR